MDLINLTPKEVEKIIGKSFWIRYYDDERILREGMDVYKGSNNIEGQTHVTHIFQNAKAIIDKDLIYIKLK